MPGPIEQVTQRGLIHGEMAAIGSVVVCWATGDPQRLVNWLDGCMVRYRPGEIGP
jgi:hypothetical protein